MGINLIKKYQNLFFSKSGNMWEQGKLSLSIFFINKPKMARFSKFKYLFALKLNFNGDQFHKKYQNMVISRSGKSHNKIVKFWTIAL